MDYINLYFHVHAKYEDEFKRAFIKVLTESSKEEGCTYIHGYQEREDARSFRIQSGWESQQAFDAHVKTAHVQEFGDLTRYIHDEPAEHFITDRIT